MKRFLRSGKGSVLLEAVITSPLHLVFIMGTLWLGTLSLDRQNLLMLDNACAFLKPDNISWETIASQDDSFENKNFLWSNGAQFADRTPEAEISNDYLMVSASRMEMTTELPPIIAGIVEIFKFYNGDSNNTNIPGSLTFASQGSVSELSSSAAWLRKNPAYSIDRTKTDSWQSIANEKFVFGPQMTQNTVLAGVAEYSRNPVLEKWSVEK